MDERFCILPWIGRYLVKKVYDVWEELVDHTWYIDDDGYCNKVLETARKIRRYILWKLCRPSRDLVHMRDSKGRTARILLMAEAQADRCNKCGRDALAHYLVNEPFVVDANIVQLLLEHGSNASFQDHGRDLAYSLVTGLNETKVKALLLLQKWGLFTCAVDHERRTLLFHAAFAGSVSGELLSHLSRRLQLDFSARDVYGRTALENAEEEAQKGRHIYFYRPDR